MLSKKTYHIEETLRGEKIALKFRWIIVGVVSALIIVMYFSGYETEAYYSTIPVLVFTAYNLFLLYLFSKNKLFIWLKYVSVTIDIGILSVHIFNYSCFFSDIAVATTASIFLYPVLMFLSVLRYDRKLIIYTTIITVIFFNLIYYIRYPYIDPELIDHVTSADPAGHFFKSAYLTLFGIILLHIPKLVERLLKQQRQILKDNQNYEIFLALEKQKRSLLSDKLTNEQDVNKKLKEQKEQIESQNQQLQELNATKDKLFSIIGHDLKNPFAALISLSKTLLDSFEDFDKDDIRETIKRLYNTSQQGLCLLDNLLDWARAQTGKVTFEPCRFYVQDIISENINLLYNNAKNKRISIKPDMRKTVTVFADKNMVNTVIRNLLSNAIKFTPVGGIIEITAKRMNNDTIITIHDTGIGISRERIEKLFNIRENITTSGTNNEKGTGLGLILCKEFIDRNEGKLFIDSIEKKGTSVTVHLPAGN